MKKQVRLFSIFATLFAAILPAFAVAPANPRITEPVVNSRAAPVGALTRNATRATRTRVAVRPRDGSILSRTGSTRVLNTQSRTTDISRSGTVARTAAAGIKTNARTTKSAEVSTGGLARSTLARATAVFNDVSKIGSGYAECRESYATCMDQMCANANDTYRRCLCSSKFLAIRDTEEKLDQAMIMLQQFQDNNLNAVDKTAEEVNAMYTATVGEEAIKKDSSASATLLDNIDKLLSGETANAQAIRWDSAGVLDLDFTNTDDIWDNIENSIFNTQDQDISTLTGTALFNAAQNQCVRLTQNRCENDAVFNMTKSSYNILITQDCNLYEKQLNTKRETLAKAIRTAEKYLREARLEEYRTHNSADVNECLAKVRATMLSDTACGEDYKRCLDPTGAYIEASTGEPIYSPRLFQLENQMSLNGVSGDVLRQNPKYNTMLDGYKKYVARDLNTCRDISDFVWEEFKRMAVIEIAQAQGALLEEVRETCVDAIAECYDTQTKSLTNVANDGNTSSAAVATGAIGRFTARTRCRDKVSACASLYGNNTECKFDGRGRSTNESACGLTALIEYVDAVDSINIAEKCSKAINKYLTDLCAPDDKTHEYPYKCRIFDSDGLKEKIQKFADANCKISSMGADKVSEAKIEAVINSAVDDIKLSMQYMLKTTCQDLGGIWYDDADSVSDDIQPSDAFYASMYPKGSTAGDAWGKCVESSDKIKCESYNTDDYIIAMWNQTTEQCTFKDEWYQQQCELVGGYYENAMCYMLERF